MITLIILLLILDISVNIWSSNANRKLTREIDEIREEIYYIKNPGAR